MKLLTKVITLQVLWACLLSSQRWLAFGSDRFKKSRNLVILIVGFGLFYGAFSILLEARKPYFAALFDQLSELAATIGLLLTNVIVPSAQIGTVRHGGGIDNGIKKPAVSRLLQMPEKQVLALRHRLLQLRISACWRPAFIGSRDRWRKWRHMVDMFEAPSPSVEDVILDHIELEQLFKRLHELMPEALEFPERF